MPSGARKANDVLTNPSARRSNCGIAIVSDDGAKISLWWATKSEWDGLIEVAGLEVEALYGGFEREPFTDEAMELVYVTRKP